jgi:dienelactone hydrolase
MSDASVLRGRLRALLAAPPGAPFELKHRQPIAVMGGDWRAEEIRLSRAAGPAIRGFLTGPTGDWSGLPSIIYCHAHGNNYAIGSSELIHGRRALLDPPYGPVLARQGIVACAIDLSCFGERAGETESALAKRLLWRGETLFGAMLAELEALVSSLPRIAGTDPVRMGVMGLSMGATLAFWLAALDPRLRAAAHLCCFADLAALIETGGHDLHGIYMMVPGLTATCSTGAIAGLIAPRPQFIGLGADDPLTPPEAVAIGLADLQAAYVAQGARSALDVLIERETGHAETARMRERVLAFWRATLLPV